MNLFCEKELLYFIIYDLKNYLLFFSIHHLQKKTFLKSVPLFLPKLSKNYMLGFVL